MGKSFRFATALGCLLLASVSCATVKASFIAVLGGAGGVTQVNDAEAISWYRNFRFAEPLPNEINIIEIAKIGVGSNGSHTLTSSLSPTPNFALELDSNKSGTWTMTNYAANITLVKFSTLVAVYEHSPPRTSPPDDGFTFDLERDVAVGVGGNDWELKTDVIAWNTGEVISGWEEGEIVNPPPQVGAGISHVSTFFVGDQPVPPFIPEPSAAFLFVLGLSSIACGRFSRRD